MSSQYSGSKSVTSTAGDTKAIAGTNDGRWRWWRQALGAGPGVQLSPPGLGSAWLRTAEEGGQATRGGREGQAPADRSAPRPRRDPGAETQQGPTRAPARPERLRTAAGERAWKEVAAAAERASVEGGAGGRSASPGQARPRPESELGGRQAAAGSEPASRKAARCSPSGSRGTARWQWRLGRRRLGPSRMRPGGRWREEGGDRAEIVVVRRVGSRGSRKTRGGSASRSRHALSPGRVSPAREASWASEWPVRALGPREARPLA